MCIANGYIQHISSKLRNSAIINQNIVLLGNFKVATHFHKFTDTQQHGASDNVTYVLRQIATKAWNNQAATGCSCPVDPLG